MSCDVEYLRSQILQMGLQEFINLSELINILGLLSFQDSNSALLSNEQMCM